MVHICIVLVIVHCYMSPYVHIFLGHERDRFEITPVISSNVEYVAVALCGRLWGTFLGYLENLDKFQGKQVLSHSFPKMKRFSCVVNTTLLHCLILTVAWFGALSRACLHSYLPRLLLVFLPSRICASVC